MAGVVREAGVGKGEEGSVTPGPSPKSSTGDNIKNHEAASCNAPLQTIRKEKTLCGNLTQSSNTLKAQIICALIRLMHKRVGKVGSFCHSIISVPPPLYNVVYNRTFLMCYCWLRSQQWKEEMGATLKINRGSLFNIKRASM